MQFNIDGVPMPRLRTRKGYWLLGLLGLNHGREVQREWLAETLWPDSWGNQAKANLNLSLTDLRKALGKEADRIESVTRNTLRLHLDGAECDLVIFDSLFASKDPSCLDRAVAYYRGPLLQDCQEPWVIPERADREHKYIQLLGRLSEDAHRQENWRLASRYLRLLVRADPFRDSAHRDLMQALLQGGDLNAALLVFQEYSRFLRENELSSRPPAEMEQLYQGIRADLQQAAKPRLIRPKGEDSNARPVSVPARVRPLIGRENDVVQIVAALGKSRLVTLTGSGGVGKTSLAAVVAAQEANGYPQGAAFVALDTLTDPDEIPSRILAALSIPPDPKKQPADSLIEFLRQKSLLLVLDNMEHLLGAGTVHIQSLLQQCPGITVLMTSRQPLNLPDETVWRVPSLSLPDTNSLPEDDATLLPLADRSDAVRLFLERAESKLHGFSLHARNCRAVIEICLQLDGIPFAIELAAARVVSLPVGEIARRLHDCYSLLSGGNSAALPRHQTLATLMDWSHNLLSTPEQQLLHRLSVFAGGFTLESVEIVCAASPTETAGILDALTSLVNHSLVLYEEMEGVGRYRLLETVRQYAAGQLKASGQTERYQRLHAEQFLAFAESQEEFLSSGQQVAILDRLDTEYDNLEAALHWSAGSDSSLKLACQMAGALSFFWIVRGHFVEGRRWLENLVPRSNHLWGTIHGKLLFGAAYMATSHGDSLQHGIYCGEALQIFADSADRLWYARTLVLKSRSWTISDEDALADLTESLEIFRLANDKQGMAESLCQMAQRWLQENSIQQRIAWFEEGLRLFRELKDYRNIAVVSGELGYLLLRTGGEIGAAQTLIEDMVRLSKHLKDRNTGSHALWLLGYSALLAEDFPMAVSCCQEGLELTQHTGATSGKGLLLVSLAQAEYKLGQYAEAREHAEKSLA